MEGERKRNKLARLAKSYGWKKLKNRYAWEIMLTIAREDVEMDIWWDKLGFMTTVQSYLNHPRRGHTTLWRDRLTPRQLKAVLVDPRAHTGKGKYIQELEPHPGKNQK